MDSKAKVKPILPDKAHNLSDKAHIFSDKAYNFSYNTYKLTPLLGDSYVLTPNIKSAPDGNTDVRNLEGKNKSFSGFLFNNRAIYNYLFIKLFIAIC